MNVKTNLIIAHRGESHDAPENTLAAINLAWERNAKAVEIDIQLTKDKEIVVIHDYDTFRVSGNKQVIKKSFLKNLKSLNVGSFKNEKWKNENIPTLDEVLRTVPSAGKLIIEIKSSEKILNILKQVLTQSGLKTSQIELIAFNVNTLAKAKKIMPNYKMLWLLDLDYYWPHWMLFINKKRIVEKVKKLNLDGVNVWAGKLLTKRFIDFFHINDLEVYTWTVNDPEKAMLLASQGINGITTDRAQWIKQQIKQI